MSNTNAGLMSKTKKELVEIINKQDVKIANLEKDLNVCKDFNKTLQTSVDNERAKFRNDYECINKHLEEANKNVVRHQAAIDELTSQKIEAEEAAKCFKNERDSARNWDYVLGIAVIVIAACWIIF